MVENASLTELSYVTQTEQKSTKKCLIYHFLKWQPCHFPVMAVADLELIHYH